MLYNTQRIEGSALTQEDTKDLLIHGITPNKKSKINTIETQRHYDLFVKLVSSKKLDGKILSNGGRVLGVTALGDSLESAITNAYVAAEKISWSHKYCRRDIGKKGLTYL